jgi:hypothetical protein
MTLKQVKTYKDFLDFTGETPILCNNISKDFELLELENGRDYNEETEEYKEIMQWYIVSKNLSEYIKQFTDEILFYHNELNVYVWGITHYGTSWDSVDIDCNI